MEKLVIRNKKLVASNDAKEKTSEKKNRCNQGTFEKILTYVYRYVISYFISHVKKLRQEIIDLRKDMKRACNEVLANKLSKLDAQVTI